MSLPRLIVVSPGNITEEGTRDFELAARRALAAGLPGLMLREPGLSDGAFLRLLEELHRVCGEAGAWLTAHDRVHLALAAEVDAVHLGFRSLPALEVRARFGDQLTIGLSTHAGDDPLAWRAADYLFHGPILDTPSKRGLLEPVGFEGLAGACERAGRPVLGIGGLRPEHASALLGAGAHGAAVISGVFRADDPGAAVRAYLRGLEQARAATGRGQ